MLKRTTGRFLLTLLVTTGLAGTVKNSSLNSQERKLLINDLKETRSELVRSVKDLSDAQLSYKPAPESWSIRECIQYITSTEKELWSKLNAVMKEPAAPEKSGTIRMADEEVIGMIRYPVYKRGQPTTDNWKSATTAISAFKASRADYIKYAKSTTEDLRNHFVHVPFGSIDAYQFMLYMAAHCEHYTRQINEIKKHPGFPKE